MKKHLLICLAAILFVPQLIAQTLPKCDGTPAIVRLSEIKPGGSMDGFMKAMDAHLAWYRNNGFKNNQIFGAKVIVRDEKTKTFSYSDKQMLTFHMNPPDFDAIPIPNRNDAAWSAYVKQYRDNSDIKTEYIICMPKMTK